MVRRPWPALVAALVVLAYLPSLGAAVVWDDHVLVGHGLQCRQEVLRCLVTPFFPSSPFADAPPAYYRPIVTLTFVLVDGTVQQHLLNVILHALNAALLALVAARLGASPLRAGLASLAWALHPRLVEDVTWISGRTDLLASICILGALLAWPDEENPKASGRRVLAAGLLLTGLLSKEVAVAGLLAVAVLGGLRRWRLLLVPAGAYVLMRIGVGLTAFTSSLGTGTRVGTVGEAVARYVEMTVRFTTPWSARGAIGVLEPVHVALGFVALAALAFGAYRAVRLRTRSAVGWALGLGSVLPVIHVVPIGLHGAVTADRVLYLPLAGLAIVVATCALPARFGRPALAATIVFLGAEVAFVRAAQHAFDDEVLFGVTSAERSEPTNVGPTSVLAIVIRDAGAPELACPLFEAARRELERTGRTRGAAYARATENLGACLARTGHYAEALALYRTIARERPESGRVALGLAYALLHHLDFGEARAAFARAAELDVRLADLALQMRAVAERADRDRAWLDARDPVVRARYAADVGRAPEAERAWVAVAQDTSAPEPLRREAVRYLAKDGSPPAARAATQALPDSALEELVSGRFAAYATVQRHEARIARIASR